MVSLRTGEDGKRSEVSSVLRYESSPDQRTDDGRRKPRQERGAEARSRQHGLLLNEPEMKKQELLGIERDGRTQERWEKVRECCSKKQALVFLPGARTRDLCLSVLCLLSYHSW